MADAYVTAPPTPTPSIEAREQWGIVIHTRQIVATKRRELELMEAGLQREISKYEQLAGIHREVE